MTRKNLEKIVWRQDWEALFGGHSMSTWCSLHKNLKDCKKYVKEKHEDTTYMVMEPYPTTKNEPYRVRVPQEIYEEISKTEYGLKIDTYFRKISMEVVK